jgi:hypothetical protein
MKTIRVYLSVLAIVFSVGGAIASNVLDQIPVYQFIDNPGTEDDRCVAVQLECSQNLEFACKVNATSPILKSSPTATACGIELTRATAPPQP